MPELPPLSDALQLLPPREPHAHKGTAGRVTLVGGNASMSGAVALAARGALRSGAGLVRVLTPRNARPLVAGQEPCAMVTGLDETAEGCLARQSIERWTELLHGQDALAIGPGLGLPADALPELVATSTVPTVLDADALNALAQWPDRLAMTPEQYVLTPHPGEARRLLPELAFGDDEASRHAAAHQLACAWNATVVLKGAGTIVATPRRCYRNRTGNAGMATGGMGDVLTGVIAALLAQGMTTFDAARLGVCVHGQAGDLARADIGPIGLIATDVADRLPRALADVCGWTA